uniref:Uncharacterized protein n=1 Tax=Glossina palpalis gambiensis TaxID=67801 RepID=A0A1B0BR13_9MUSC
MENTPFLIKKKNSFWDFDKSKKFPTGDELQAQGDFTSSNNIPCRNFDILQFTLTKNDLLLCEAMAACHKLKFPSPSPIPNLLPCCENLHLVIGFWVLDLCLHSELQHIPIFFGFVKKLDNIDISGGTNCSRYVGLSSFIWIEVVLLPKLPRIFILSFTRCFVIEVTVFQTLLSSEVSSVASFIVINAYAANDIYVAIKLSNNNTFNFGMSSSFSRAKSALKLATPGHFEGDVQIVVGSSPEYRWYTLHWNQSSNSCINVSKRRPLSQAKYKVDNANGHHLLQNLNCEVAVLTLVIRGSEATLFIRIFDDSLAIDLKSSSHPRRNAVADNAASIANIRAFLSPLLPLEYHRVPKKFALVAAATFDEGQHQHLLNLALNGYLEHTLPSPIKRIKLLWFVGSEVDFIEGTNGISVSAFMDAAK